MGEAKNYEEYGDSLLDLFIEQCTVEVGAKE